MDANYPKPSHDLDDFKNGLKVVVEFQIVSQNLKASKKSRCCKSILFLAIKGFSDQRSCWNNSIHIRKILAGRRQVNGYITAYKENNYQYKSTWSIKTSDWQSC